jgi:hypothetical protein
MVGKNESLFNDTASNLPGGKGAGRDAGHSEAEVMNVCNSAHIYLPIHLNEMHVEHFSLAFSRKSSTIFIGYESLFFTLYVYTYDAFVAINAL